MKRLFSPIGTLFGRFRRWVLDVSVMQPGHWRWAASGIMILIALVLLGMGLSFIGAYHIGIFAAAIVFFGLLPYLSGLGVRLGLKIVGVLPDKYNWLFFGGIFFVLFLVDYPLPAMITMVIWLILAGSFLGGGLYNLTGGRWYGLDRLRRALTLVFFIMGLALFVSGSWFILFPGKSPDRITNHTLESTYLPEQLKAADPSVAGPYGIDSLTYGWGGDRRFEFGEGASMITPRVDGSSFIKGWEKLPGKIRSRWWRMEPDSLAINGRVWYPDGNGPFPFVLMVHGNHGARDFSDPGYDYLGRHFASHGIIAVSVDENFLNGDWSDFNNGLREENDCRGWLLLKHLEQWRQWNDNDTSLFYQRVDLDRVILIGHSRGGEAVSIASCFNRLPFYPDDSKEVFNFGFGIRGIAAIAPVDGQYWPAGIATPVKDVNYFTIHGSMDGDLRSFHGIRQMRRVIFEEENYHFVSGLYVHGANHGQFNRNWGKYDQGYPRNLTLNRKAIIPVMQQEQVALVYLTAFVKESLEPGSGYLQLFKDARSGRDWLPDLVFLNQFHESTSMILCGFEEDIDLTTGTFGVKSIRGFELSKWYEDRIPMKWGNLRNSGVFLGWNNEKDSVPGYYRVNLDSSVTDHLTGAGFLTFLAGDAQIDAGEREKEEKDEMEDKEPEQSGAHEGATATEGTKAQAEEPEQPEPPDFTIGLVFRDGSESRFRLGDYNKLQPPIKPEVFKSKLFFDEPESEVMLQYVSIPLDTLKAEAISSVTFEFDQGDKGAVIIDQLGFSR